MATRILREWVIAEPFADLAALKALDTTPLQNSVIARVFGFGLFEFSSASVATGDDLNVVDPTTGPGRWLRITPSYLYVNSSQKVLLQYIATADGQAGGTTLVGGNGASENLLLSSTTSATKGYTRLGVNGLFVNETNGNNNVSVGSLLTSFAGTHVMFSTPREGTQYDANFLASYSADNDTAPSLIYAKSRGTIASPTIVQTNDELGLVEFLGYDGTNYRQAAQIFGLAGNTITPGSVVSGRLEFDTADAAGTMQEVMNLDASKNTNIFGAFRPNNDAGTSGYVLTSQGAGTYPVWSAAPPPSGAAGGDLTGTYPNPTIGTNKVTYAKFQQPAAGNVFLGVSGGIANYTGINVTANSLVGRGTSSNLGDIKLGAGNSLAFGTSTLFRAALTGDVTASADSNATTIANNAVTYAKFQQAAAGNVVLCNPTASAANYSTVALSASQLFGRGSTGNLAAITLGSGISMSGTTLSATGTAPVGNIKTVGVGGDYATWSAAFAAGAYNLLQISNIVETADFTFNGISANIFIYNPNYYFYSAGTYSPFQMTNVARVNCVLNRAYITFAYSSAKSFVGILDGSSAFYFNVQNSYISNSSSVTDCYMFDSGPLGSTNSSLYSTNNIYYFANQNNCGFNTNHVYSDQDYMYGGGTSCETVLGTPSSITNGSITNLHVQGQFNSFDNTKPNFYLRNFSVSNLDINTTGSFLIRSDTCRISNINKIFSGVLYLTGDNVTLNNFNLGTGYIDFVNGRNWKISNGTLNSFTDSAVTTSVKATNVTFTSSAQTLTASGYQFTNCQFWDGSTTTTVTIQSDYNTFGQCKFGNAGGSNTIDIQSGAASNIFTGCFYNTLTDSGTATQLAANIPY